MSKKKLGMSPSNDKIFPRYEVRMSGKLPIFFLRRDTAVQLLQDKRFKDAEIWEVQSDGKSFKI